MQRKKEVIKIGIKVLKKPNSLVIKIRREILIKFVKYGADNVGSIKYDKKSKEAMIYFYLQVL